MLIYQKTKPNPNATTRSPIHLFQRPGRLPAVPEKRKPFNLPGTAPVGRQRPHPDTPGGKRQRGYHPGYVEPFQWTGRHFPLRRPRQRTAIAPRRK